MHTGTPRGDSAGAVPSKAPLRDTWGGLGRQDINFSLEQRQRQLLRAGGPVPPHPVLPQSSYHRAPFPPL